MEDIDNGEQSVFPTRAVVTLGVIIGVIGLGVFFWYARSMNLEPGKECEFRGGTWLSDTEECVFEGGISGGSEQVGMTAATIALHIPDTEKDTVATFTEVEIGASYEASAPFPIDGSPAGGSAWLSADLGRVHKGTQDLVMPFVVNFGGTGMFVYLGVFEKKDGVYVGRSAVPVGDRIGVEGLMLSSSDASGAFTARLSYRDRREGEAMAQVPTEPRAVEVTIKDHTILSSYMTSRDGLHYKDILKVKAPALRAKVASPLTISGEARGTWFFEASFPVTLLDAEGKTLVEGYAQADGEWMTENFVPFTATLTFTVPSSTLSGTLILKKDNPSGMPENDDAFQIPVTF